MCSRSDRRRICFIEVLKRNTLPAAEECSNVDATLIQLAYNGNRKASIIAQSVLASANTRGNAKQKLLDQMEKHTCVQQEGIPNIRTTIGKVKFASLRRTYEILNIEGDVPKHDYSLRINARKVASSIQYLEQSLQVKPGSSRDVAIAGHVFKNMPIYERGGKNKESMYDPYTRSFDDTQRIGR